MYPFYNNNSINGYPNIISQTNGYIFGWDTYNVLKFTYGSASGLYAGSPIYNSWQHIAVTYDGANLRLFQNGSLLQTNSSLTPAQFTFSSGTSYTFLGATPGTTNQYLPAYISNMRLVYGQCMYAAAFTPPTGPLTPVQGVNQAGRPYGTVLLLRNAPAPGRIQTTRLTGSNSGSVLSFPPSAMTGYSTALNAGYGQGTYVASASSENTAGGGYYSYRAFDKGASTNPYSSTGSLYAASGAYTGTVRSVDVNGTSYSGEWLQIQMPSSVVLSSYSLQQRQDGYGNGNGEPTSWTILGSNDGTNWSVVEQRTFTAWAGSATFFTFTVASQRSFSFYRFVGSTVGSSAGTNNLCFAEWTLNGTLEAINITNDGRVGLGVVNPTRALEVAGDVVCAGTLSAGNPLMFRNRIINGDMRIAQRGTSVTAQGSGAPYLVDRWAIEAAITTGQFAYYQNVLSVSDTPYQQGFRYASNIVVTTALTNYFSCTPRQSIENQNVSDLMWGTPFGVPVTVSLWIKTSAAAGSVIPVSIRWSPNAGTNYYVYPFSSVGAGPGIWQYISFTVPPPPTTYGAAPSDANSGFNVYLGNGYQGTPAVAGTWTNTSQFGSSTQTNTYGTSGTYFTWTGVQLEKGLVATPFEVRPYATELALCQRYYEISNGLNYMTLASAFGATYGSTTYYKVTKRANPTVSLYDNTGAGGSGAAGRFTGTVSGGGGNVNGLTCNAENAAPNSFTFNGVSGYALASFGWNSSAEL